MPKSQLLVITYYLQISWDDMNLELTLGALFDKRSWSIILSASSSDFFQKMQSVNFTLFFYQIYYVQNSTMTWMLKYEVRSRTPGSISISQSYDHNNDVIYIKRHPHYKFLTGISCQEVCKQCVLTGLRVFYAQVFQIGA